MKDRVYATLFEPNRPLLAVGANLHVSVESPQVLKHGQICDRAWFICLSVIVGWPNRGDRHRSSRDGEVSRHRLQSLAANGVTMSLIAQLHTLLPTTLD